MTPEIWSYLWWVQFGLPLLGALGTILVSAVAVWATLRIAQRERHERRMGQDRAEQDVLRAERMSFGLAALKYFESAPEDEGRDPAALAAMLKARFKAEAHSGSDFFPVQMWLEAAYLDIKHALHAAERGRSPFGAARMAAFARERLIEWMQTGDSLPIGDSGLPDLPALDEIDPPGVEAEWERELRQASETEDDGTGAADSN